MPAPSRRSASEIQLLVNDLGGLSRDLKRELRPAIREAAKPVLAKAKANASWSSRIPGATRIAVATGKRAGVRIETNRKKAPHARAWEDIRGRGQTRHRVYGRDVWVSHRPRPSVGPAVEDSADDVTEAIDEAVLEVARRHGFR